MLRVWYPVLAEGRNKRSDPQKPGLKRVDLASRVRYTRDRRPSRDFADSRANSSAGEHLPYTQRVTGSIPVSPTSRVLVSRRRGVAGLTYVPVTHETEGSNPFASAILKTRNAGPGIASHAAVAQLVEQRTENPRVASSTLACGTMSSGSGSVVEHRLAKARAAGSNPVFRSIDFTDHDYSGLEIPDRPARSRAKVETGRDGQAVRQGSAKPLSPVRFRVSPPKFSGGVAQLVRALA